MPIHFNRDRMMNAPKGLVASAAIRIFDRIQDLPKEIQVLAIAGAFLLTAEVAKLPVQDIMTAIKNLMADPLRACGLDPKFAAAKYHLKTELFKE